MINTFLFFLNFLFSQLYILYHLIHHFSPISPISHTPSHIFFLHPPMHKSLKRISFISSAIFNPTLVLLFSIFACSLLFVKPLPKANIQVKGLDASGYRRILTFSPNVDLEDQFNFNVKQIFVYLRVIYPSKSSEILWSRIVQRGGKYKLNEVVRSNYEIKGEVGRNVILELRGNYFPFVGIIRDFSFGSTEFIL